MHFACWFDNAYATKTRGDDLLMKTDILTPIILRIDERGPGRCNITSYNKVITIIVLVKFHRGGSRRIVKFLQSWKRLKQTIISL